MLSLAPLLVLTLAIGADGGPAPAPAPAPEAADWSLTLPEAIRLGLTNSEVVRVLATDPSGVPPAGYTTLNDSMTRIPLGYKDWTTQNVPLPVTGANPVVIAPAGAVASVWTVKSALLAHVRSVEQQYWALAQARVNLASREAAVNLGEEILRRERAEETHGPGTNADIAEALQHLENFKLNQVTALSDLVTIERNLRNILGVSASDDRHILPTTSPRTAKFEPNWETSFGQMHAYHPEIAAQREVLANAALREAFALDDSALTTAYRSQTRQERERQQAYLREVIQQATQSIARFQLEQDMGFKQYQTAQKLQIAANQRLKAQQAFYSEGRITIDRLLDAVSQDANATAQEAQYLMTYNTALAAYEEARGTLLEANGVVIAVPIRSQNVASTPEPTATAATKTTKPSTGFKVHASVAGYKLLDVEVEKTATTTAAPK